MSLSTEYIVSKFFQYVGYPQVKKNTNTYIGGCPICREGSSWGRKRRFYYIPKNNVVYCHNCGYSTNPLKWIHEISGMSYKEIYQEAGSFDYIPFEESKQLIQKQTECLPHDCINLFDITQLEYYKNNEYVNTCLRYIRDRKIDIAVNRPKTLWFTLSDYVHKNRLIIPFYDINNKIIFYQSREIINSKDNYPKYLSKSNSDKSIFNINQINNNIDTIFIFEGPINSCFVQNGVAVAGIQEKTKEVMTSLQHKQIKDFMLYKKIWILDSQWLDKASYKKTEILIDQGYSVFLWPESHGRNFKDFNDICIRANINKIPLKFIKDNTYSGMQAKLRYKLIRPLFGTS